MRHHMWGEHEVARHALRSRVALGPLANRRSRQGVVAGLSFVLRVVSAARASRDHSKKSTLRERIRLREKCLQAKFCGRRGQGIHAVLTAVPLISSASPSHPEPDPPHSGRSRRAP